MRRRAILTLMEGSFEEGFPAILQISSVGMATAEIQVSGKLPSAPQLWEAFKHWQLSYRQMRIPHRIKPKKGQITNISCHDLGAQLTLCFNDWLNSGFREWQKIRDSLQRYLNSTDEIELLIQTSDSRLRQLPWHTWNFLEHYPHAEVALSTSEYRRPQRALPQKRRGHVKILAILGDSTGINVEKDRAFLEQLSAQAQTKFLVEPQPDQLNDQLWEQEWDILFFAGHSSSQEEGQIWLNQTDSLTIAQLKYALQKAVENGLRLAIVNSCDGLSLGEKLADLQIGQTIVMREPVPDAIAQAFLKYFLAAFTGGQSLSASVREARQRLLIFENQFPYASWLPVIFAHPGEVSPTWQELCGLERDSLQDSSASRPSSVKHCLFAALVGSIVATALVMGVRQLGVLQAWELQAFDHLMQLRPPEPPDPRLLIVTVTEEDVQNQDPQERRSSSLSERSLTQLLEKLQPYRPKVIGLDIYRDFPINPKYEQLKAYLQANERLVGVCEVGGAQDYPGIRPAPELPAERLSFSDVPVDADGVIRRQLLGMALAPDSFCQTDTSFSFRVAQLYLANRGIDIERTPERDLQIGNVLFKKLQPNAGGYHNLDALGFQVLLNYRSFPEVAEQITLTEILKGPPEKVPAAALSQLNNSIDGELPKRIENRIVLIGTTARSFKDYFPTPYSAQELQLMPGVIIQAHMISQILSAVEDKRPLLWWLPAWGETVWVWSWALLGGGLILFFRTPIRLGLVSGAALFFLYGICFILLLEGGWVPLVPSALAGVATGGSTLVYTRLNVKRK